MNSHQPIPLHDIRAAQERIRGTAICTPLIRLNTNGAPAEIFLKLENLQPVGSFKLRGAANAIGVAEKEQLGRGVWAASAGNWALGLAWCARRLELDCTVILPEDASATKVAALRRLEARIVRAPRAEWAQIYRTRSYPGMEGLFIHAFSEPAVMAGNGTIGLEILDELPDVDAVVIPYGGGGLCCGVASALRAVKPNVKVYACEVETMAPLAASLAHGGPLEVDHRPSFVDGIGLPFILPEMWQPSSQLLDGSLVVALDQVTAAIAFLAERNRVIAEGAGAVPVAAAMAGMAGGGRVVCVVSGGNIDLENLARIFQGELP